MLNSARRFNQHGDTIVEVLLVLAVLGLAISISYATANRSLLNARQAQESSVATALLQSQLEAVRTLAPLDPAITPSPQNVYQTSLVYCVDTSTLPAYTVVASTTAVCNPPINASDPTIKYNLSVTYTNPSTSPASPTDTFTAVARWPDVRGQGTDSATLVYRAHKAL